MRRVEASGGSCHGVFRAHLLPQVWSKAARPPQAAPARSPWAATATSSVKTAKYRSMVLAGSMGDEMLKGFEWTKQMVRRIQSWMAAPTQFTMRL